MKYKKIVLFFFLTLPLSLLLRTLQLFFTVETDTGFFKIEYKTVGFYFLALIIAVCVSMAIICFTGHRNPEHPPKINPFIAVKEQIIFIMKYADGKIERIGGRLIFIKPDIPYKRK